MLRSDHGDLPVSMDHRGGRGHVTDRPGSATTELHKPEVGKHRANKIDTEVRAVWLVFGKKGPETKKPL